MTRTSLLACLFVLTACNPTPAPMNDAAIVTDAGPPDTGAPMMCAAVPATCIDQQITMLDLFETVSTRAITEEGTTSGVFVTHIDATAGGLSPTESFVYARFTPTGLAAVAVSDSAAFDSQAWDIAFRRYIIRLNSGVSGESCVQAARTAPGTTFDTLTSVPATLDLHSEVYMTASCDIVPDGSGLPGAPSTVLSSYWAYPEGSAGMGCLSMTNNVYVIALANGRHVKLQVIGYYDTAAQTQCNTAHTLPTPSTSGNIRVQWAYLD